MSIPFTQYLMPDGRTKQIEIDRPANIEAKAAEIIAAGCRLEAEVLRTGEVSFTVFNPETEEDEACELSRNGPEVLDAVDRLILNFTLRGSDERDKQAGDTLRSILPEAQ